MVRRSRRGHLEEKQKSEYLTVVQRSEAGDRSTNGRPSQGAQKREDCGVG